MDRLHAKAGHTLDMPAVCRQITEIAHHMLVDCRYTLRESRASM